MYATSVQAPPAVTFHLGSGRREATTRVQEPAGVILLYRIRAPLGTRINAWTQLPSVVRRCSSAPL
ncbi:MAG: hypothetical protein ACTHNU_07210, partial [Gaiellales bacterium]